MKKSRKLIVNESIFENDDEFVRFCNMSKQKRIEFLKERDIKFPGVYYGKKISKNKNELGI